MQDFPPLIALKVLSKFSPRCKTSLRKELRVVALSHPNIINMLGEVEMECEYELGLAMELANGDLSNWWSHESFTLWELRDAGAQMLAGLEYLHRQGIVHNDLKPGNVLVFVNDGLPEGDVLSLERHKPGAVTLKLTDFGLSRHEQTLISSAEGVEVFMAPEALDVEGMRAGRFIQ